VSFDSPFWTMEVPPLSSTPTLSNDPTSCTDTNHPPISVSEVIVGIEAENEAATLTTPDAIAGGISF
jgi:hypothetical protein